MPARAPRPHARDDRRVAPRDAGRTGDEAPVERGHEMLVTETTVKSQINHLYGKTGARDRAQAVAYAYRHRLAPGAD